MIKRTLARMALIGAVTVLAAGLGSQAQAATRCQLAYQACFDLCGGEIAYFECLPNAPYICECY